MLKEKSNVDRIGCKNVVLCSDVEVWMGGGRRHVYYIISKFRKPVTMKVAAEENRRCNIAVKCEILN